jgi:hypothetical protein
MNGRWDRFAFVAWIGSGSMADLTIPAKLARARAAPLAAEAAPQNTGPAVDPFASRVRCLGALGAGWRSTALGPGLLAAGPASTDPTPLNGERERDQRTNRITTMTTAMTRATIAIVRVSTTRPYSVSPAVSPHPSSATPLPLTDRMGASRAAPRGPSLRRRRDRPTRPGPRSRSWVIGRLRQRDTRCRCSSNSIASGRSFEQRQTAGLVWQQQSRPSLLLVSRSREERAVPDGGGRLHAEAVLAYATWCLQFPCGVGRRAPPVRDGDRWERPRGRVGPRSTSPRCRRYDSREPH